MKRTPASETTGSLTIQNSKCKIQIQTRCVCSIGMNVTGDSGRLVTYWRLHFGHGRSIFREGVIGIAVEPAFSWLCRCDHRVSAGLRVLDGVTIRRRVAAQRHAARLARSEMHPRRAYLDALLALRRRGRLISSIAAMCGAVFGTASSVSWPSEGYRDEGASPERARRVERACSVARTSRRMGRYLCHAAYVDADRRQDCARAGAAAEPLLVGRAAVDLARLTTRRCRTGIAPSPSNSISSTTSW